MYMDFLVNLPDAPGKLARQIKKGTVYIDYEYDRTYEPSKQYTYPKRTTIGKLSQEDPTKMQPNQNFFKYFPETEFLKEQD